MFYAVWYFIYIYITYCVIHILHYIAYCVDVYRSKDRMPNYIDNCTVSIKSRNPSVLAGTVDTAVCGGQWGTILLNRVRTIFPVCRRRKHRDDAGFWLGCLATHRSYFSFSEFHPSMS